jgi:hypothetical protein
MSRKISRASRLWLAARAVMPRICRSQRSDFAFGQPVINESNFSFDTLELRRHLSGQGLRAYYFDNDKLQGPSVLQRVDATIDFNWGYRSPAPSLPADRFSAVWVGKLRPTRTGTHTFFYTSNNMARLWVDNALIIDNFKSHGTTTDVATISLRANVPVDIRADFVEEAGTSVARLEWQTPGGSREVVPARVLSTDDRGTSTRTNFPSGEVYLDTAGQPINAHGGWMMFHNGTYYWYGESRTSRISDGTKNTVGMSVYSSTDLLNWRNRGLALSSANNPTTPELAFGRVIERPRVIYNARTKQFVMWLHVNDPTYREARVGTAVSSSPTGPFRFIGAQRPLGFESRDITLFQDTDGKAYLYFASDNNRVLRIVQLSDDYTKVTTRMSIFKASSAREAATIVKFNGRYHMITSGTTGWLANAAQYHWATSPMGPWNHGTNPITGPGASTTNNAQGTALFPVAGRPGLFIFMADRWRPWNIYDSRYVWKPVRIVGTTLTVGGDEAWNLTTVR